ncbi:MAG TPA: hypothetical protein ENK18_06225 [Deltaproteobacteria bacterium]|nr:hypothetical protein [Deltaproteobacteria bacterium]
MEPQQLTDVVERIKERGARGVELLYVQDRGHALEMRGSRVEPQQALDEEHVVVRVWLEGGRRADRRGAVTELEALISGALAAAEGAEPDPAEGPVGRLQTVTGGLGIRDRRYEQLTSDDRIEVLTSAQRSVKQVDRRLDAVGFRYRDRLRVRRFCNSRGVSLEEWSTTYSAEGTVNAAASPAPITLHDRVMSRSFASIASLPYGTSLARRAVQLLADGEQLPEGPVRVLMPARVVARLVAALGASFRLSVLETPGAFFLRASDTPVVDPRLHLVDDGTLSGGLRTCSLDDRGVAPVPLTLLREGRVDGRFIGVADARRLDVRPTGHQVGGALTASNLVLKSGTRSINACLSDLGGPSLQIDDLPDLDGLDLATGAFRFVVNGLVMEANQVVGAMRGVTLTGSLLDVLNAVVEVCSDTDRLEHVDAPALIAEGFTLEG